MKLFILRHKILFSILSIPAVLIAAVLFYEFAGQPVGQLSAQFDQLRGNDRIKIIGMPLPTDGLYAKLLREKYAVKTDRIAYCTVTHWEVAYHEGYNAVALPAIQKKFGDGVFNECHQLAIIAKLKEPDLPDEARRALESDLFFLKEGLQAQ